jgi:heme exporter protein D
MAFHSMSDFWAMGGHGFYVWLAYGATAVLLTYNIVQPILKRKTILKELSQKLKREENA